MNFLDKIFNKKKEEPIHTSQDFWAWFKSRERNFYSVIKEKGNVKEEFFNLLSPKLNQLKEGYGFLAKMQNDYMAELIITADGVVENIAFAEDLVNDAPHLPGWKITALKPALDIEDVSIQIGDFFFNKETLAFYANENPKYPDEIDLTLVYKHFSEDARDIITNGVFDFLDNYLGELRTVTGIDAIDITGDLQVGRELISIEKLKDYLVCREKEFLEKYIGVWHHTENDRYVPMTTKRANGNLLVAVINVDILQWEGRASHPWVMVIIIKYNEHKSGMPDEDTSQILEAIEDEIAKNLKDFDGYLHIGRQTADGNRELYFACRDFRKPSKLMFEIQQEHSDVRDITFEIYKDKYWRTFNRFKKAI